jgi:hypothetical protein
MKFFLKFGRVGEIYIPKKLDNRGRRFGFVKFKEVKDVGQLSERLRDVWIGTFKLIVNRSRFARSESKEAPSQKVSSERPNLKLKEAEVGRSFQMALMGGGRLSSVEVLKVPVNEELCGELQGSVVGTLAREKDVRQIQTTLLMEGFKSISVTHMGGNMALLRSTVECGVGRLLRSKNECIKYYFTELKLWNPGLFAVQRGVWIQVYGFSLHIWGDNLFKMIGKSLGMFMDYDDETARMVRFDVARLKILTTTWAVMDVNLKVEVEGVCFNLWVVEERERQRSAVVLRGERDDEGSRVVPSEGGVEVYDGFSDGAEHSDEDEVSGEESDGDARKGV